MFLDEMLLEDFDCALTDFEHVLIFKEGHDSYGTQLIEESVSYCLIKVGVLFQLVLVQIARDYHMEKGTPYRLVLMSLRSDGHIKMRHVKALDILISYYGLLFRSPEEMTKREKKSWTLFYGDRYYFFENLRFLREGLREKEKKMSQIIEGDNYEQ